MEVRIKPITITIPTIKIDVDYKLGGVCIALYRLFDSEGNQYTNGNIILTAEEVAAWGTDDNYIVNLILSKLGIERE